MSKVQDAVPGDGREAFHRATMAVYADLGALIEVLKTADLRVALLVLDEHATPGSAPVGDPEFVADLKHAASRLRRSLATVQEIREEPGLACAFGKGGSFGSIGGISHHDALAFAAQEVLEPDAEGAARSGRTAQPQSASGVMRQQVVAAATDAESWARLAENLKHEYALASLHPPSPIAEPKPVAKAIEEMPFAQHYADAMTRYIHSCDDVRTLHLNPLKATPFDQRPEETQMRGGAIFHGKDPKSYVRYLLRIAAENERTAMQARSWWAWWEKSQVEPSKAGPAPLIAARIEEVLRRAAARRSAEPPMVTRPAADGETGPDLGRGGPSKVFDAICKLVMTGNGGTELRAGHRAARKAVIKLAVDDAARKKASDYLSPTGRLCVGGWVERDEDDVVLTKKGARVGNDRLRKRSRTASQ